MLIETRSRCLGASYSAEMVAVQGQGEVLLGIPPILQGGPRVWRALRGPEGPSRQSS